ncbi:NAD(+)/NADH kinase [bacterium endosymbiont of Pedicinus badii]|uniref:NAD(+)/NADH kinase n=1 Tax=bacterium endosymbiont of Pedicinus badii TaxID=1719126 RepID=UPI0009B940B8|nr:NAD(+)/NADH kinase [bacterium endosymbiont of Pedicinus badii]OQM34500.1 hypothetical protein AOQ89_01270 [bacterium endosymbiont of Pedicinus badii]
MSNILLKKNKFQNIGISGKYYKIFHFLYRKIYFWLKFRGYNVFLEDKLLQVKIEENIFSSIEKIGKNSDLIIVFGGNGNMLRVAKSIARYNKKIIGINTGNLGFLMDLNPKTAIKYLSEILIGNFFEEKRIILKAEICLNCYKKKKEIAINEIILHAKKIASMIDYEVYINDVFSFSQRSDGLIISTPTGSTAYSLSSGGPIIHPSMDAIILNSIFPHNFFYRTIVIHGNSKIKLKVFSTFKKVLITLDGRSTIPIASKQEILIYKSKYFINFIHPKNFNYFRILKKKLCWSKSSFDL